VLQCENKGSQEGRELVTLVLTKAATIEGAEMRDVQITAFNPASTNPDEWNRWLVSGRAEADGPPVGWGYSKGVYGVAPMAASLEYPPAAGDVTMMLGVQVTYRALAEILSAGSEGFLELRYRSDSAQPGRLLQASTSTAESVSLRCDLGDPEEGSWRTFGSNLWKRSGGWTVLQLPDGVALSMESCSSPGEASVTFLVTGIKSGIISLTIEANLEIRDGEAENMSTGENAVARWDISLKDKNGNVVDMFPGLEAGIWWGKRRFALHPQPLFWAEYATAGIDLLMKVNFNRLSPGETFSSVMPGMLCLNAPTKFNPGADAGAGFEIATAKEQSSERTLGESLDILPAGWLWAARVAQLQKSRFCVETDVNNMSSAATGTVFGFSVLVSLPDGLNNWPADIIWRVDLCEVLECLTGVPTGKTGNRSETLKVTFPVLGFMEGESHPGWVPEEYNHAHRICGLVSVMTYASLLALSLSQWCA